ncbi:MULTISPECIES: hypothetical protein [unclassified Curtobacterium]|uniref:hypothetical protein n=1 Tax=unclassified Curtobacterium TaxID=257496 RepID=UPI0008DE54F3|nr:MULTISPECIES: hypothetical protein [unclassified Curtobacterium]OIH99853.1 hypothetical protein BIU92_03035 [Curtobacterium sp. MCBA15_003]OII11779.1 hypothetical protein BIU97_07950 [Curtobacterium sp. MCBA15_009]OII32733.1 hypothetical protein BIU94_16485 [Curtobacterium sp. MMLR14_006]
MRDTTRTTRTTLTVTALLAAGLALAGCAADGGTDPADAAATTRVTGSATPSTGTSSTPRPTSTITQVPGVDFDGGSVPDSCTDLVTPGRWDDSFAKAPLNDPSVVGDPIAIPKSAFTPVLQPDGKRLYCVWREPQADISYLSIAVDVVDSATASDELQALTAKGYDCGNEAEGFLCQKVSENEQYPVTDGDTYFTRGDIGIHIRQSNIETTDLLEDVTAHVF